MGWWTNLKLARALDRLEKARPEERPSAAAEIAEYSKDFERLDTLAHLAVRRGLVPEIGKWGDARLLDLLIRVLGFENPEVREQAAAAIGALGLHHPKLDLGKIADTGGDITALGACGHERAGDALLKLSAPGYTHGERTRTEASVALAQLAAACPAVKQKVEQQLEALRKARKIIAEALGR